MADQSTDKVMLEQLRGLTDAMLVAGEAKDWEQLEALAAKRLQLVSTLSLSPESPEQATAYRSLLESIRRDDEVLKKRGLDQRSEILSKLRSGDKANKMKVAYGKTSRKF